MDDRTTHGLRTCIPSEAPSETVADNAAYRGVLVLNVAEGCGDSAKQHDRSGYLVSVISNPTLSDAAARNELRRDLEELLQAPSPGDFHSPTRESGLNRSDKSFAFSASPSHW